MLTRKQEEFALAYVLLGVATDAYLRAYNVGHETKRKTVWEMSCRLLRNRKVAARISELREVIAADLRVSIADLALELTHNRSHALDAGKLSAANAATRAKAKLLGYI